MAVVQYSNVYRSGAASGAPVTSIYICDDFTNFPVAIAGDIAFVKSAGLTYLGFDGGWIPIVVQDMRFALTGDLKIEKVDPLISLTQGNGLYTRYYNINNSVHLTSNSFYVNGWGNDNTAYDGLLYVQDIFNGVHNFYFNLKNNGGLQSAFTIDRYGNIGVVGAIYERQRPQPLGQTQTFAFSSGNVWSNGAAVSLGAAGSNQFQYAVIGDRIYCNFLITLNIGPGANTIYIHTPGGLYYGLYPLDLSACIFYDVITAHVPGRAYIQGGNNYISFTHAPITNIAEGLVEISGQLHFAFHL